MNDEKTTRDGAAKPLRLLVVEDSPRDAEIVVREIRSGGFDVTWKRVDTAGTMRAALDAEPWDVVVSDYSMPNFDGLAALRVWQEKGLDIPFIIVSGKIGEETAVAAMKAGVHDYIMKDRLARLAPAIERELREAKERHGRKRAEERVWLANQVLNELNRREVETDTIRDILQMVKESTGIEAVGIRLKEGDDFPYYETSGFPDHFVQMERYLCERDASGKIVRDTRGNPVLECMCGNIIRGRFDPKFPFFTEGGSFWSNCTTELLASTTEEDRQARTRNRCNGAGYESVALIPLRSGNEIIGLLQLNDHRRNQFTPEMIRFFEGLGASIGIALGRKRAEEALRESEEHIRQLIEFSPIAMVVSSGIHEKVVLVNQKFVELFGYTIEDIPDVAQWWPLAYPDKEYRETIKARWQTLIEQAVIQNPIEPIEATVTCKDGGERYIEFHLSSIGQRNLVAFSDLTERKRAEEALKASEERFRLAAESATDLIYEWDLKERVDWFGKIDELLGYARSEFPSTFEAWANSVHPNGRNRVKASVKNHLEKNEPYDIEYRIRKKDGTYNYWWARGTAVLDEKGNPSRWIGAVTDITERKAAQDALLAKNEELKAVTQQLWQAAKLATMGGLASSIAHELNNPLATVSLRIESLTAQTSQDDKRLRELKIIGQEIERMGNLVTNLLQFSRRSQQQISTVDVREEIEKTFELIEYHLRKNNVKVIREFAPDVPFIHADRQQLRRNSCACKALLSKPPRMVLSSPTVRA